MFNRGHLPLIVQAQERAQKNGWYRMRNLADGEAEVFIYDVIGASFFDDGITASEFVRELRALEADRIHVRVNSPGGNVWEALAIAQALDEHPAEIWTHIDGIGASAASWVGIRSAKTIMAPKSRLFIHDPHSIVLGNAREMRAEADVLDGIGDDIADFYAAKAALREPQGERATRDYWRKQMLAETWFSDQQAVDAGLADEIASSSSASREDRRNTFDTGILAIFKNTPTDLLRNGDGGATPLIRRVEDALRDAGLSRTEAKRVLANGWDGYEDDDVSSERALVGLLADIRAVKEGITV